MSKKKFPRDLLVVVDRKMAVCCKKQGSGSSNSSI